MGGEFCVDLFKPLCDLSFVRVTLVVIPPVIGHLVHKEKREHLDPQIPKAFFLFQVLLNGLSNLHPHDLISHTALFLGQSEYSTVGEFHLLQPWLSADVDHNVSLVAWAIGQIAQISPLLKSDLFLPRSVRGVHMDSCLGVGRFGPFGIANIINSDERFIVVKLSLNR